VEEKLAAAAAPATPATPATGTLHDVPSDALATVLARGSPFVNAKTPLLGESLAAYDARMARVARAVHDLTPTAPSPETARGDPRRPRRIALFSESPVASATAPKAPVTGTDIELGVCGTVDKVSDFMKDHLPRHIRGAIEQAEAVARARVASSIASSESDGDETEAEASTGGDLPPPPPAPPSSGPGVPLKPVPVVALPEPASAVTAPAVPVPVAKPKREIEVIDLTVTPPRPSSAPPPPAKKAKKSEVEELGGHILPEGSKRPTKMAKRLAEQPEVQAKIEALEAKAKLRETRKIIKKNLPALLEAFDAKKVGLEGSPLHHLEAKMRCIDYALHHDDASPAEVEGAYVFQKAIIFDMTTQEAAEDSQVASTVSPARSAASAQTDATYVPGESLDAEDEEIDANDEEVDEEDEDDDDEDDSDEDDEEDAQEASTEEESGDEDASEEE
jgi:hypothetical protein